MISALPAWYLAGVAFVVGICLVTAVRGYRLRNRPGATTFSAMMVAITIWCVAYAFELAATTKPTYLTFLRIEYVGSAFVPVLWFLFVLEYTGRDSYTTPRWIAGLFVVPVLTVLAVWTNPVHHLMWTERTLLAAGGLAESTMNVGFWTYLTYTYLLLAGAMWFLAEVVASESGTHRRQALALVVAALLPWGFQVLHFVGPAWAPAVNLTSFSFALSGVVTLAALEEFGLLATDPVAARVADDRVVETLDDGVLVADAEGTVVDANPTAERFLETSLDALQGRSVDDCVPALSDVSAIAKFGTETVTMSVDGEDRHVEVSASAVETAREKHSGWVVTMHDVTERRRRERRSEVLNRVLTRTLQEGEDDALEPAGGQPTAGDGGVRERARSALEVGDVTKEFEGLLSESASADPVDVVPIVQAEADRIRDVFPGVELVVDAPLGEWAHCGGLFEPTCRALLRHAATTAAETDGGAEVHVGVSVVDDRTVSVSVSLDSVTPEARRRLSDGMDVDPDVDGPESARALSCWLGHWGVERLGGTLSVDGDAITLELPQVDDRRS